MSGRMHTRLAVHPPRRQRLRHHHLLAEEPRPTRQHYKILALCGSLLLFRLVTGLGVGGEWATGHTYIGETFPPRYRGRYASVMQTGGAVGCLMAAAVGGFLEPRIGWRWCFVVSALPTVLSAFVLSI